MTLERDGDAATTQNDAAAPHGIELDEYHTRISPLGSHDVLAQEWQSLQEQSDAGVFLDWLWIETWLAAYQPDAVLARVEHRGILVALGLFVLRSERRHGLLFSQLGLLHQTGQPGEDQIWIEYNGLIAASEHAAGALHSATETLLREGHCREVSLSMLPVDIGVTLEQQLPRTRRLLNQPGFYHRCADHNESDPLPSLSSNTRAQIRRSLRLYEDSRGHARIEAADSVDQALEFLHEAGAWHKQRWQDSGFENAAFTHFHESLIKRGFDHGRAQLFRVAFGDYVVGVFYFLVHGNQAYFYLQGVRSEENGKLKPGLTGHYLLMRHFFANGVTVYDFMGGDSQYKRQLASGENAFVSLRVDNGDWRFRVEDALRFAKQRLFKR